MTVRCGISYTHRRIHECVRKPTMWVPTRSDTNCAVQSQKMFRGWKFWIQKGEELYYPCSENKGADQLRGYREADLRLCFHICRLLVFPCGSSHIFAVYLHIKFCFLVLFSNLDNVFHCSFVDFSIISFSGSMHLDLIIFLTCCEIMNSSEIFPDQKEMADGPNILLISFEKFYFELAC